MWGQPPPAVRPSEPRQCWNRRCIAGLPEKPALPFAAAATATPTRAPEPVASPSFLSLQDAPPYSPPLLSSSSSLSPCHPEARSLLRRLALSLPKGYAFCLCPIATTVTPHPAELPVKLLLRPYIDIHRSNILMDIDLTEIDLSCLIHLRSGGSLHLLSPVLLRCSRADFLRGGLGRSQRNLSPDNLLGESYVTLRALRPRIVHQRRLAMARRFSQPNVSRDARRAKLIAKEVLQLSHDLLR